MGLSTRYLADLLTRIVLPDYVTSDILPSLQNNRSVGVREFERIDSANPKSTSKDSEPATKEELEQARSELEQLKREMAKIKEKTDRDSDVVASNGTQLFATSSSSKSASNQSLKENDYKHAQADLRLREVEQKLAVLSEKAKSDE